MSEQAVTAVSYRLRPLPWKLIHDNHRDGVWYQAESVFGNLNVYLDPDGCCRWEYCFDEYYDEGLHVCGCVEEGKRLAEAFYQSRLLPALEEVQT